MKNIDFYLSTYSEMVKSTFTQGIFLLLLAMNLRFYNFIFLFFKKFVWLHNTKRIILSKMLTFATYC